MEPNLLLPPVHVVNLEGNMSFGANWPALRYAGNCFITYLKWQDIGKNQWALTISWLLYSWYLCDLTWFSPWSFNVICHRLILWIRCSDKKYFLVVMNYLLCRRIVLVLYSHCIPMCNIKHRLGTSHINHCPAPSQHLLAYGVANIWEKGQKMVQYFRFFLT